MRTKTLLLVAAAAAAGIATASAQTTVYSVNAVGYVNTTIPKGFALISNPLVAQTNTIAALLTGQVPQDTAVYVWDTVNKTFKIATYDTSFGWDPVDVANTSLMPGGGVFIKNPTAAPYTITFVGEVPQGAPLSTPLVAGLQIVSSQVPQSDTIVNLGYVGTQDDKVYQWDSTAQTYTIFTFDTSFGWDPTLKPLAVGEAVFLSRTTAGSWSRTFSVNQ
jgi:hypothetical protein